MTTVQSVFVTLGSRSCQTQGVAFLLQGAWIDPSALLVGGRSSLAGQKMLLQMVPIWHVPGYTEA